ncbi:type II toxin-antitoxin system RelE/ParE family toxin [bacterium]|nr:type II toxin-antitoxin system RelE/ParE family toxin [bacterium]
MPYHVRVPDKVEKEISKLPTNIQRQVVNALNKLAANPRLGVPLRWQLKGYWSYRIGRAYRIDRIDDGNKIVWINRVRHRRHVYRK